MSKRRSSQQANDNLDDCGDQACGINVLSSYSLPFLSRHSDSYQNRPHINCVSAARSPQSYRELGHVSFPFSGIMKDGVDTARTSEISAQIECIRNDTQIVMRDLGLRCYRKSVGESNATYRTSTSYTGRGPNLSLSK
jgi:hypothetical protein